MFGQPSHVVLILQVFVEADFQIIKPLHENLEPVHDHASAVGHHNHIENDAHQKRNGPIGQVDLIPFPFPFRWSHRPKNFFPARTAIAASSKPLFDSGMTGSCGLAGTAPVLIASASSTVVTS